ncbi:MAG: UDP-glucose 4-epimerase [Flavobacteriaceae bacterium]|nr:UDP-glucose 4-epimerase [Flavobacteriaceae bacterium]|tara:strand:- start:17490 stop:17867 length:378 start_codon:yes stop_codon:yes gene_type:complete
MNIVPRVTISEDAKNIVDKLRDRYGDLMFHQSGGCCDGSSPMCFEKGELMLNENDVWMGKVYECDFYMSKDQFEYWQHTQLTLDVTPGRGASFSLEIPLGLRFVIKSRLYTESEREQLQPIRYGP